MDEREEAALKAELIARLGDLHTAVLQKLDGLSDYDLRRPLTATGSNLLGIVKHLASIEAGYFGDSILRELLDESAGRYVGEPSMPTPEEIDWVAYRAKVQAADEEFLPT